MNNLGCFFRVAIRTAGLCALLFVSALACGGAEDTGRGSGSGSFSTIPCGEAVCGLQNAAASCVEEQCELSCEEGFADCDGDPTNGCEESAGPDGRCAKCGGRCTQDEVCVEAARGFQCQTVCDNGKKDPGKEGGVDCGGVCFTKCAQNQGCETNEDCAEGLECSADKLCQVPPTCSPGPPAQTRTTDCGTCGQLTEFCDQSGQWRGDGKCVEPQGACTEGQTMPGGLCGNGGGVQLLKCINCQWVPQSCDATVCPHGDSRPETSRVSGGNPASSSGMAPCDDGYYPDARTGAPREPGGWLTTCRLLCNATSISVCASECPQGFSRADSNGSSPNCGGGPEVLCRK